MEAMRTSALDRHKEIEEKPERSQVSEEVAGREKKRELGFADKSASGSRTEKNEQQENKMIDEQSD
jgi:hypothetical protein